MGPDGNDNITNVITRCTLSTTINTKHKTQPVGEDNDVYTLKHKLYLKQVYTCNSLNIMWLEHWRDWSLKVSSWA